MLKAKLAVLFFSVTYLNSCTVAEVALNKKIENTTERIETKVNEIERKVSALEIAVNRKVDNVKQCIAE